MVTDTPSATITQHEPGGRCINNEWRGWAGWSKSTRLPVPSADGKPQPYQRYSLITRPTRTASSHPGTVSLLKFSEVDHDLTGSFSPEGRTRAAACIRRAAESTTKHAGWNLSKRVDNVGPKDESIDNHRRIMFAMWKDEHHLLNHKACKHTLGYLKPKVFKKEFSENTHTHTVFPRSMNVHINPILNLKISCFIIIPNYIVRQRHAPTQTHLPFLNLLLCYSISNNQY